MSDHDGAPAERPGVTVVLPAYNAGEYLQRCLDSLLAQSLDRGRYDIIAVDDGSTDGTGERLDRVAAEHPDLIRVEHIENSGWPGRPRNLAVGLSDRRYVFFCDADDWLPQRALEAMLTQAEAHDADILMGRVVGNKRRVNMAIYEKGDYCTSWRQTPGVFGTLTCQKLFRRGFLNDRDVHFGEGRVRLEDFIFMTTAYLRAERISILGSQPCYVFEKREDGGNLTATRATEDEYFASVERIIDIVLAETEPGPEQDIALDRVVRSELIGPLSRPPFLRKDPGAQAEALAHGTRLLRTKVPPSAVARQDPSVRNRARAIEQGDLAAVVAGIRAEESIGARLEATAVTWQGHAVCVDLEIDLHRGGTPVELERRGDTLLFPPRIDGEEPVNVTHTFERSAAHLHLRLRGGPQEWRFRVPVQLTPETDPTRRPLSWTARAVIDPATVAGGQPLGFGVWDLHLTIGSSGLSRAGAVRAPANVNLKVDPARPPTDVHDGVRVRPYWTKSGHLAVTVRDASAPTPSTAALHAGDGGKDKGSPMATRWSAFRRTGWRRRAVGLAARAGLTVTDVGPGVVLLSRSARLDVQPLTKGRRWLLTKRGAKPTPPAQPLGDKHLILTTEGTGALDVTPVGSRGWLVTRPDAGPLAEQTLENQVLQHLGTRHVTWLLNRYDVDLVLDVGANTGQYGQGLRRSGYRGRIASFEPVPAFADTVEALARDDDAWTVHRMALGSTPGTVPIRVQRTFSSLLPASDYGKDRFRTLRDFAEREDQVVQVPVRRLDEVLGELLPTVRRADGGRPRVFLKMDTQGFDLEAFRGLGDRVSDVVGLQSEVALLLIYEGMPRMPEAVATYEAAGFELSGLYPVTTEPDGRVIEYDCVMVRAAANSH